MCDNIILVGNFKNHKLFGKRLTDNIINIEVIDEKEKQEQERIKL